MQKLWSYLNLFWKKENLALQVISSSRIVCITGRFLHSLSLWYWITLIFSTRSINYSSSKKCMAIRSSVKHRGRSVAFNRKMVHGKVHLSNCYETNINYWCNVFKSVSITFIWYFVWPFTSYNVFFLTIFWNSSRCNYSFFFYICMFGISVW